MKPFVRILFALVGFILCFSDALAQQDDQRGNLGSSRQDSVPTGIMPVDTAVPLTFVLLQDERQVYVEYDSFTWADVHHDPLGFGYAHLGNLGSAYRSLKLNTLAPIGFSTGWQQYDPYYVHEASFRYYAQNVPVTKIKYAQASQEDTYLTLDFGRSFAKGISLSLAYRRINQIGEFAHQRQKDTGLGIGVWHNAPSGKYDAFYNLLSNSATTEENGGVVEPDSIGRPLNPDNALPTFITQGLTNHKHRAFLTKQIFHLTGDSSSLGIDVWVKAKFETGLYKYVDDRAAENTTYYPASYLIDDRGIRQYTWVKEHQESLGLTLPWKAAHSTVEGALRYRGINVEQEPVDRKINEVFVDVAAEFQWIDPLKLSGKLSVGLGQATGTYALKTFGDLKTGILGHLEGHWFVQSRNPYLMESLLFVNQQLVYNTSFKNPFSTEIGISWKKEEQDFDAGIRWIVHDHFIYFDSMAFPQQLSGSFSLKQFYVSKGFDFGAFGGKGVGIWQPDTRKESALPETMFSASLYGRIKIFQKKLTLLPGVDLTYYGAYPGISYFPVNGMYHLTDGEPIPEYVRIDAGLGININFIKAFIRMEDIRGLFEDRALYQADFYPHYRGYLRLGLTTSFFN